MNKRTPCLIVKFIIILKVAYIFKFYAVYCL